MGNTLEASCESAQDFHVPKVFYGRNPCCHLLDIGSGETGFYTYAVDDKKRSVKSVGSKVKRPFYDGFVICDAAEEFTAELVRHFIRPDDDCSGAVTVNGGITGILRELLVSDADIRKAVGRFLHKVEDHFFATQKRMLTIRVFVLSSKLEAMFELQATEWLMHRCGAGQKTDEWLTSEVTDSVFNTAEGDGYVSTSKLEGILHDIGNDAFSALSLTDAQNGKFSYENFAAWLRRENDVAQILVPWILFVGSISAGGGSSQLTLTGERYGLQLFSAPCGNRTPITEGIFSAPVTSEQLQTWAASVHSSLVHANFPQGLTGLFVGISAVFYAAKECGLAGKFVSRATALQAIHSRLNTLDRNDLRTAANLVLLQGLLQFAFADNSFFLFRRDWSLGDESLTATWTLGLCIDQGELLRPGGDEAQNPESLPQTVSDLPKVSNSVIKTKRRSSVSAMRRFSASLAPNGLFETPAFLVEESLYYLMDIGSSEIGFYTYAADPITRNFTSSSVKIDTPFFDGYVDIEDGACKLAEEMCRRFGWEKLEELNHETFCEKSFSVDLDELKDDKADTIIRRSKSELPAKILDSTIMVVAGATGLNREELHASLKRRITSLSFLREVELWILHCSGQRVEIRLFVPSGELEATFELRATEWLIQQSKNDLGSALSHDREAMVRKTFASADKDASGVLTEEELGHALKKCGFSLPPGRLNEFFSQIDIDGNGIVDSEEFRLGLENGSEGLLAIAKRAFFMGTISAGGGSCQLTLCAGATSNVQLFSAPVGNRVPTKRKMFSSVVTSEELDAWSSCVREALRSAEYPRGLTGLYVGISALYHAAKACSIDNRIVCHGEVLQALTSALQEDPQDHRRLANLVLVRELLSYVFSSDAVFLFKRAWLVRDTEFVATWTLGMFVAQYESSRFNQEEMQATHGKPTRCPKNVELSSRLKQVFQMYDRKCTKTIGRVKLRNVLLYIDPSFPEIELEALLNHMDEDGSGLIGYEAFVHYVCGIKEFDTLKARGGS